MKTSITCFEKDESGATAIEYGSSPRASRLPLSPPSTLSAGNSKTRSQACRANSATPASKDRPNSIGWPRPRAGALLLAFVRFESRTFRLCDFATARSASRRAFADAFDEMEYRQLRRVILDLVEGLHQAQ